MDYRSHNNHLLKYMDSHKRSRYCLLKLFMMQICAGFRRAAILIQLNSNSLLFGTANDGHFAYWTVRLLFGHFAYWTLRLLVISPTTWTVRLQIALHFTNKTKRKERKGSVFI